MSWLLTQELGFNASLLTQTYDPERLLVVANQIRNVESGHEVQCAAFLAGYLEGKLSLTTSLRVTYPYRVPESSRAYPADPSSSLAIYGIYSGSGFLRFQYQQFDICTLPTLLNPLLIRCRHRLDEFLQLLGQRYSIYGDELGVGTWVRGVKLVLYL